MADKINPTPWLVALGNRLLKTGHYTPEVGPRVLIAAGCAGAARIIRSSQAARPPSSDPGTARAQPAASAGIRVRSDAIAVAPSGDGPLGQDATSIRGTLGWT